LLPWQQAVELAELYADGGCSGDERLRVFHSLVQSIAQRDARVPRLHAVLRLLSSPRDEDAAGWQMVIRLVREARTRVSARGLQELVVLQNKNLEAEYRQQAIYARDVAGNPFAPRPALHVSPQVLELAHSAYEERHLPAGHLDGTRLAVLADAVEEAGCTSSELLKHLRSPGPHVRGCWALDLVLGLS
jgi:hypothetical protein